MTETEPYREYLDAARQLGREHARETATWAADGNSSRDHVLRVLAMIEDGDPAAESYLPDRPNLSGEFTGNYGLITLYERVVGKEPYEAHDDNGVADEEATLMDGLADAYEEGVAEEFESACAAELRKWV